MAKNFNNSDGGEKFLVTFFTTWAGILCIGSAMALLAHRDRGNWQRYLPFIFFAEYLTYCVVVMYAITHPDTIISIGFGLSSLALIVDNPQNFKGAVFVLLCGIVNLPIL